MKTKVILTSTLFVLLMVGFANVGEQQHQMNDVSNQFKTEVNANTTALVMKGIIYNDEILPHRVLPEVEILGKRNPETLTKAKLIDGEVISVVELDEVVIHANL